MLRERFGAAQSYDAYVADATVNQELWVGMRKKARVSEDLVRRVEALGGEWRLLVLSEDWCGDAFNSVPYIAALADAAANLELRILPRDRNPELMDSHLTNGSRSIPVVMVLTADYREMAWWGPRPRDLQTWVMLEGKQLPTDERYRRIRTWYARDQGRTTLEEVVSLMERAEAERQREVA